MRWSKIRVMTETTRHMWNIIRQLGIIAAIMVIGYTCDCTLRFTSWYLNTILRCAFLATPFLAIRPVLQLHQSRRMVGLILLTPVLLISSGFILIAAIFDGLGRPAERTQLLQILQEGNCTIQLERYENGGALGIHGLNLEQRRRIVPGLYLVRSIDFFDSAWEGTLTQDGTLRVRVHASENYRPNDAETDRVYSLKPWVYF
jgi:hypothetical protein